MKFWVIPLRTRIYLAMIFLMAISFSIIGFSTAVFFKNQNETYHIDRMERKESALLASINYYFRQEREGNVFPLYAKEFDTKIKEFADIHSLILNIYDVEGNLITSSDMDYFTLNQSENEIPDEVIIRLESGIESVLVTQKKTGIDHYSTYTYLKNLENVPVAIINLPYLYNIDDTKAEFKGFIKNLAAIYFVLFFIAMALAFYLSRYITKSLRTIGQKIKSTRINQKNDYLYWPSNDDIGALVNEYNRMIKELEESAQLLAQSEREGAWRDMAKQVAHEIKNPLTPMKLSVQQLERAWRDKAPDFEERLLRFKLTMEEQIDVLSSIAEEFSTFAKMPETNLQKVDIIELLKSAIDLYKKSTPIQISLVSNIQTAYTIADKNQLLGAFNNLIKNAIQAIDDVTSGYIEINCVSNNNYWQVTFIDNGEGINPEVAKKLFVPYFTTKSKGVGLGLPIVKNSIESFKGNISFTSNVNSGTIFTVNLLKS